MTQPVDPAVSRLLELVETLGGAATVSRGMSKHPQLFYNLRDGKSKFSLTTLTELAIAFPGKVDANYIIFGVSSENVPYLTTPDVNGNSGSSASNENSAQPADLDPNGKPWKQVAEYYRKKYETVLTNMVARDHPELFAELSKTKSNGHTTEKPSSYHMGFVLSKQQQETANLSLDAMEAYAASLTTNSMYAAKG